MINDFKAVVWKEWREIILQHGSVRRWALNMLLLVAVIGIFLPLQFGRMTIDSVFFLMWIWMPLLNVVALISDSIAGERERHTLETLLASRLPDSAIMLGKIAVIVIQSWLMMLAGAVMALVVVNLFKREDPMLILYPAPVAFGIIVMPVLIGVFVAGMGAIASMGAATVRQAYQRIAIPMVALVVIPSLGLSLLPQDLLSSFYSAEFAQNNLANILVILTVVLVILDTVILSVGLARFRRPKLIG